MKYKIISNISGIQKTIDISTKDRKDKEGHYKIFDKYFKQIYGKKVKVGVEGSKANVFVHI